MRVSGTQTWIGRNPRSRDRLRCARTFSRDERRFGADRRFELEVIGNSPEIVTCNILGGAPKCNTIWRQKNLASRFRRLQSHGNRADPVPPPIRVKAAGEFIALHLPDAVKARAGSRSEGESSSLWLWPWIHPPWQLRRVPQNARSRLQKRQRIDAKLTIYATNGSGDVKRLKGADGCRLRIGDWRVILIEDARSITVIAVETAKRFTAERKTS